MLGRPGHDPPLSQISGPSSPPRPREKNEEGPGKRRAGSAFSAQIPDILFEVGHSNISSGPRHRLPAAETGTDEEILAYGATRPRARDFTRLNRVGATVGFGDVPNDIRLLDASGRVVGRYTGSKDEVAQVLPIRLPLFLG